MSGAASGSEVTSWWKRSNSASTSATVLPFKASVISDADAREMAHPVPSKVTSVMRSPSISRNSVRRSPQSGLKPSHVRSAHSSLRKFRGRRLWSRMTSW